MPARESGSDRPVVKGMCIPRLDAAVAALIAVEQVEIDGFCHGSISGVVGMKVVALVESRQDLAWVVGILHHLVEVDYGIEAAARADPLVYLKAHGFL